MSKLLLFLNIILVYVTLNEGRTYKRGRLNGNSLKDETSWPNLWFPHPTNYQNEVKPEIVNVAATAIPNVKDLSDKSGSSDWPGLWFPFPTKYDNKQLSKPNALEIKDVGKKHECDNEKDIGVDFDPEDMRHSYKYLCFGNRADYAPNLNTSALMKEHLIPIAYEPPVKCLSESIEYSDSIPTFGAFRPLAPKFGSYKYLPPQRWLHSLADGAIILLYHPCAFAGQVERLQTTLRGCLYRHIITPYQQLTAERPLALLAWGKTLQLSVVDDAIVVNFIKENAKTGFRKKQQKLKMSLKQYDAGLLNEAHLVTDDQDKEICGYKEIR